MAKQRAKTSDQLSMEVSDEHDVGIDPHKKTLTASVLDGRGGMVATASFKVSGVGHRALVEWATGFGAVRRWGIENASGLGRHTAIFLIERGCDVRDGVPDAHRRAVPHAASGQDRRVGLAAHRP
jgi:transposase